MKPPAHLSFCTVAWREHDATITGTLRWTAGEDDLRFEPDDGGEPRSLWSLDHLLQFAPPGETVHLDFGVVRIGLRAPERDRVHATIAGIVEGERREVRSPRGAEAALKEFGDADAERSCPRTCFWCAYSDYTPGAGFVDRGHLACFVADGDAYLRLAQSDVWRDRKLGPWKLAGRRWVDEFGVCDRWTRRPRDHGYRG